MKNKDYIIKDPKWQASQDYQRLRKEGLQHIEQLGHQLWTDYNTHDPGITQLELLCYAITDLGHRTSYDIKDILTTEVNGTPAVRNELHTAREIFSCNPVSFNDLRKYLIDIAGVRNVWIRKHSSIQFCVDKNAEKLRACTPSDKANRQTLNGLYDVYVDYEDRNDETQADVIKRIKKRLFAHRNLCEDVINICELSKEDIALCADLEVTPGADINFVMREIFYRLDQFISPEVKFYTIQELLDKGKSTDEIFSGPALEHGFIDDDEFQKIERRCALRVSDIIQLIMDIPEVVSVKDISLLSFIDGVKRDQQKWILNLATDEFRSPYFNSELSRITFYKNGLPYFAKPQDVTRQQQNKLSSLEIDLPIPLGNYKSLEDYYPVQNEMPASYRVGQVKVPESASAERKAQSKQLKAWLLFFEQMLANYLSQLAHLHELFSWQQGTGKTYFTQKVTGIHDIENLYADYDNLETELDDIIESDDAAEERKNKFLDHLLARFCESFTDYSTLMYNLDEGFTKQNLINDKREFLKDYPKLSQQRGQGFDYSIPPPESDNQEEVNNISGYQKRVYRLLGINKLTRRNFAGKGFSIEKVLHNNTNHYQFQLKNNQNKILFKSILCESRDNIETLLDFALGLGCCRKNYQPSNNKKKYELLQRCENTTTIIGTVLNKSLLEETVKYFQEYSNAEGFHLIEHNLLRRRGTGDPYLPIQINKNDSCDCVEVHDPYSFHLSIILPSWPKRFQNLRFRQFVEETLRIEAPAHIQAKICWLSHTQMQELEVSYNTWATLLSEQTSNIGLCRGKVFDDNTRNFSGEFPIITTSENYTSALENLINMLHSLTTVYPLARLHDCKNIDTDTPPITLNNTILGTF